MSEWKEIELGEVLDIVIDNRGRNPSSYKKSGIPVIDNFMIQNQRSINLCESKRFIDNDTFNSFIRKYIQYKDVLITLVGNGFGNVSQAPKEQSVIIQNTIGLRGNNKIDNDFLFYNLRFNNEEILNFDRGAVQPSIKVGDLKLLNISLPPLPEQKAIAEVLSSLDDKIDLLHRQNKTLEQMAETLFRQWFIEEADESWEEGKLGDVIDIFDHKRVPLSKMQRNKMKDGRLYPYYGAASIMDYVNNYLFDGEYILLGEDGTVRTEEGYPVLQYASDKFWVNNHAHIFQAKKPYSNFFIWNYLSRKNIDSIVTGAVQPKINQRNLKSLEFPKFPIELVIKFNDCTEPIFKKIKSNTQQIRALEKLRDTLLPKLMSGEVRVRMNDVVNSAECG